MAERVLVTGGAGFIGSHLVDALLARGDRVTVLDNLLPQAHPTGEPRFLSPHAELRVGDVRDQAAVSSALSGVEAVYHLAAMVGNGQSMYDVQRYADVNVGGTAALLEVLARTGRASRLVVASSMVVYGDGAYSCAEHGPLDRALRPLERLRERRWEPVCPACGLEVTPRPTPEEHPLRPNSTYGVSKRAAEELALVLGRAYRIPTIALRFLNTYGSRQALSNPYTGVAAILASRLLSGRPPLLFEDGEQRRDFTHVSDVVAALLAARAAGSEAHFGAFNVGTGRSVSVLEVARALAEGLGRPQAPLVTGEFREGDIRHCFADVSRADRALGWRARVSFAEGTAELVRWARGERPTDRTDEANDELRRKGLLVITAAVIPALDEEGAISGVVRGIAPHVTLVIVVDNGSRDRTADRAAEAGARLVFEPARGYGAACLAGAAEASRLGAEVLLFLDADGSDDPDDAPALLRPVEGGRADLALGIRTRAGTAPGAMTPVQRFGNALAPLLMRALAGARYRDMPPFKAIRREAFERLSLEERTYGFTIELLLRAHGAGLRVLEIPVRCGARRAGSSKVSGTARGATLAAWKILTTIRRHAPAARRAHAERTPGAGLARRSKPARPPHAALPSTGLSQRFIRCPHCSLPHDEAELVCPVAGKAIERRGSPTVAPPNPSVSPPPFPSLPPLPPLPSLPRLSERPSSTSSRPPLVSLDGSNDPRGLVGQVVDGMFLVKSVLGRGGMATVYEGEQLAMNRPVALKVLPFEKAASAEASRRFLQEARAAASIPHPNICQVFHFGTLLDGSPYFAMERLVGEPLAARIDRERGLAFLDTIDILMQVLAGLSAAHKKGIVHRDIKPDNVFLVPRDARPPFVKVLDFGVAKFVSAPREGSADDTTQLTRAGMVMGTPFYMAPEQAVGDRNLDARADLWATGVILYEAVVGRRPFHGHAATDVLSAILSQTPRSVSELRPGAPPEIEAIVDRALQKDPARRYRSAIEFLTDLQKARARLLAPARPRTLPPPAGER